MDRVLSLTRSDGVKFIYNNNFFVGNRTGIPKEPSHPTPTTMMTMMTKMKKKKEEKRSTHLHSPPHSPMHTDNDDMFPDLITYSFQWCMYLSISFLPPSFFILLFLAYPEKPTLTLSRSNITAYQGETITPLFLFVTGQHTQVTLTPSLPNGVSLAVLPAPLVHQNYSAGYVISGEFSDLFSRDYLVCLQTMEDPVCLVLVVTILPMHRSLLLLPPTVQTRSVLEVFDTIQDVSEYSFTIYFEDEEVMNREKMMSSRTVLNLEDRDGRYRILVCRTKG